MAKPVRLAINGFGRIGRLLFRQAFALPSDLSAKALASAEALAKEGMPEFEIVAVNDLGDLENLAYLLKYDTVYGRYSREISIDKNREKLVVDGKETAVLQEKDPAKLPWKELNIDIAVEATGLFESFEKAKVHLAAGAKRVVITAPAKDAEGPVKLSDDNHGASVWGKTVLMGINEKDLREAIITSNGSCTTNAVAPVIQIMSENPGIEKAILNTVHAYTATQNIVDGPVRGGGSTSLTASKDFRRGRSAAQNIVPSTTGAAIAVTRVVPDLEGKFDGIAIRVPVACGSIADITFLAKRKVTVEEINDIFRKAAAEPRWQGILKVSEDQLVSADVVGEPYGAIVDLGFTKVIDGDLVKVFAWYDNEMGYVATLVKHIQAVARFV